MPKPLHAFDYLSAPEDHPSASVCVLFGDEPFLKGLVRRQIRAQVLGADEEDVPFATFDGSETEWRDVIDELSTVALFGPGNRLALVEDADKFVTANREKLEDYVAKPARNSVLVLDVSTFPGNTKLYKAVVKSGLAIQCNAPEKRGGKRKEPDPVQIARWISDWSKRTHDCSLDRTAADLLLELVGPDLGMLDQSLAKLALFAGPRGKVTPEMVRDIVGGWRTQTIWDLMDAAADGDAAAALQQLEHLLHAGEKPIALFGQISWSLRRYATTTRLFQHASRNKIRITMPDALIKAGFRQWPKEALQIAGNQMKQLGRHRAGNLYRWLLDADLALKGTHSKDERARLVLELLIVRLSKELQPQR